MAPSALPLESPPRRAGWQTLVYYGILLLAAVILAFGLVRAFN